MKLTKVNNLRIAVSSNKQPGSGYSILYPTPNSTKELNSVEVQVEGRIKSANRLYGVFFRSDIPNILDKLFEGLVNQIRNADVNEKEKVLQEFTKIVSETKIGKQIVWVEDFSYSSPRKHIKNVLGLYVRERLVDKWQVEYRRKAAVEILCCLCDGKNYAKKIMDLNTEVVNDFIEACLDVSGKAGSKVFVYKTRDLETAFTELIKLLVKKCKIELYTNIEQARFNEKIQQDIAVQIDYAKNLSFYENKGEKVYLNNIFYYGATTDRMDAVVERMRRTMKRGNNRKVAVKLLIALANKSWKATIEAMMNDEVERKQLIHFIYAANIDYHRLNIIRSIKRLKVKVKVNEESVQEKMLILSSAEDKKKVGLNETLISYASSKENADKTLLRIKGIVFDYFLGKDRNRTEEDYFKGKGIWSFPNYVMEFFGDAQIGILEENKPEAQSTLENIMSQYVKINKKAVQRRIRYANYGIYKQMMDREELDELDKYWIKYIKEFVDKNYVDRKKGFKESDLYSTNMMKKCWESIIQYLCGKYIDLGKVVYHCAMPTELKPEGECQYGIVNDRYKKGLSSFDYEEIKAKENLQRDIAEATVAAISNFSRSILDYDKELVDKEDVVIMADEVLKTVLVKDNAKRILRYFGGESNCACVTENEKEEMPYEIKGMLREIRNENFHYTSGKKKELTYSVMKKLFENDVKAYIKIIKEKYYTNNVARFYDKKNITDLVEKFYKRSYLREAQIPAFSTLLNREKVINYIGEKLNRESMAKIEGKKAMFEGAIHFLLKEIYCQDFTVSGYASTYFFNAVEAYFVEQGGCVSKNGKEVFYGLRNGEDIKTYRSKYPYHDAAKSFVFYVDKLKMEKMSLGNICQAILTEYNQQNSKMEKDETIFKHYKLLFELCMRNAFIKYVDDNYAFIKEPVIKDEEVIQDYLEKTPINCLDDLTVQESDAEKEKNKYMWYMFAHFIHPKQLNHLVGDFKNYIQFRKDIIKRAYYAKEIDIQGKREWEDSVSEELKSIEEALQVFEFVRGVAGRVSNVYKDYYKDEEEYAQYLSQHIDFKNVHEGTVFDSLRSFCQNALPDEKIIDIYADEKNPKVLRNIELSRMYAGGDIILEEYDKVSAEEIKEYYEEQPEIQKILSEGLCQSREEQIRVRKQQSRKERITLNDITGIWQIIYDLHAKLVSMAYLRERDEMYLLLGFYYLALQNPEGWPNEKLETLNMGKVNIESGFVLYSVVSVFTYGLNFIYESEENGKSVFIKQGGETAKKISKFDKKYKDSLECALRIFENTRSDRAINDVRNYVDHFKYFIHHDKSIVDLYNEYYQGMFTYSSKLQKSVWENFVSILKKEHVLATLLLIHRNNLCCFALNEEKVTSEKFTFKLKDKSSVCIDAKEVEFLKKLCAYLNYRR